MRAAGTVEILDINQAAADAQTDEIVLLETNLDDVTPEVVGHCLERLLAAGALDAYVVPIYMKKSRPASLLTVLADPPKAADLEAILFAETTTLGVRWQRVRRSKLSRRQERVETPFGQIGVKIGCRGREIVTVAPEYDDCRDAARRHDIALRVVMDAARRAWDEQRSQAG